MIILNPDPYSLPSYRIGPFRTTDLSINHCLPDSDMIDDYLSERFKGKDFLFTENGRKAINIALSSCKLKKEDVVTILTTSGNFYISGCVTAEIEKFCRWSREILPETKVLFVNHEFGYPFADLLKLKDLGLQIIEDCAGSFFSTDDNGSIGETGDFVIYSFPKMFPLQIGGLLVSNVPGRLKSIQQLNSDRLRHIKNVLSYYINRKEEIILKRILNYNFLRSMFESIFLAERFKLRNGCVPGVFMFMTDQYHLDLHELKKYYWAHGVQCSVFYGEESFFIPVHQALNEQDMLYFYEVMKSFIER